VVDALTRRGKRGEDVRGADGSDLVTRAGLDELVVDKQACGESDLFAIGGRQLDFKISHCGKEAMGNSGRGLGMEAKWQKDGGGGNQRTTSRRS